MQYIIAPKTSSVIDPAKIDQLAYSSRTTAKRTFEIMKAIVHIKPAVLSVGAVTSLLSAAHKASPVTDSMSATAMRLGAPEPKHIGEHAAMPHASAVILKGCLSLLRIQEPQLM